MKNKSSESINQHIIPQFILRNFTFGEKDQIYVFDKQTGRIFPTNISNAAVERRYNEYELEGNLVSIEAQLERLESRCAPIIRRIIDGQSLLRLSIEERLILALFVAIQYTRTNHQRNLIKQIDQAVFDVIQKIGGDPYNADGFSPLKDDNEIKQQSIRNTLKSDELVPLIIDKTWLLIKTEDSTPFYISDHPVTLQNYLHRGLRGNLGIGVKGIEIYMPLSKTLTLAMLCPTYEKEIRETYDMYEKAKVMGKQIGLPPIVPPHKFDPRIGKLLEGFDSGDPMMCSGENTMNLNRLQVVYSSRFIYASKADFSLAEEMIDSNPDIRFGVQIES